MDRNTLEYLTFNVDVLRVRFWGIQQKRKVGLKRQEHDFDGEVPFLK